AVASVAVLNAEHGEPRAEIGRCADVVERGRKRPGCFFPAHETCHLVGAARSSRRRGNRPKATPRHGARCSSAASRSDEGSGPGERDGVTEVIHGRGLASGIYGCGGGGGGGGVPPRERCRAHGP